jgi:hypothetical protein
MFGRTTATVLLALACQLASGCCYGWHPFLCCRERMCGGYAGGYGSGGCCDSCVSGYSPPPGVPVAPMPVINAAPVQQPPATGAPGIAPIDKIPSFGPGGLSPALPTGIRR